MEVLLKKNTRTLQDSFQLMARKIEHAIHETSFLEKTESILRFEIPIEDVAILPWLSRQKEIRKFYWADRDRHWQVGAVGTAHLIHGNTPRSYGPLFKTLRKNFSLRYKNLRYYGGISFDSFRKNDPQWQAFGGYQFILPRFEVIKTNGTTLFACNLFKKEINSNRTQLIKELNSLSFPLEAKREEVPLFESRKDFPPHDQWIDLVETILKSLRGTNKQKVVLARKSLLKFKQPVDPFWIMEQLTIFSPHCFHFFWQPKRAVAFLGASPEMLYEREGRLVKSEAIAGTRCRGSSEVEDEKLRDELLTSDKENREHDLVVKAIREVFGKFCRQFEEDKEKSLLQLEDGQHLISRFSGILNEEVRDEDLLKNLHPTPAVGGSDRRWAKKIIRYYEPFSRGWYTGLMGCVGADTAAFAVAIRSGLVCRNQTELYSGAGIVKGSNPQEEWKEVENKIGGFLRVLCRTKSR